MTRVNVQLGIEVCAEDVNGPIGAQCRVNGTHSVFNSTTLAPQPLAIPCTTQGLACLNSDQPSGNCFAYDIQFQCNGLLLSNKSFVYGLDLRLGLELR